MYERNEKIKSKALLAWIIGYMSSLVYALEAEEAITVNKIRGSKTWIRISSDIVRCFCNLPQCISTGYMCKSGGGGCFSNFHEDHHSKDYRGRHGCLELLNDEETVSTCESASAINQKPTIFCCYHDMCNHMDSPQVKAILNNTLQLGDSTEAPKNFGNLQQPIDYTNSQVWFRAATIAVPVCGAVILFVLIVLAVKILRGENQNSSTHKLRKYEQHLPCDNVMRPKCAYHHPIDDPHRIRVPLLIPEEITGCGKNETNAKVDLTHVNECKGVILDIEKIVPKCSKNNLVDHVNTNKLVNEKFKC